MTTTTTSHTMPAFYEGLIYPEEYTALGTAGRAYVASKVGTGMHSEAVVRNALAADRRAA